MLTARIGYAASAAYILPVYLKYSFLKFSIYSKNHWKQILTFRGFVNVKIDLWGSVGSSKEPCDHSVAFGVIWLQRCYRVVFD